MVIQKTIKHSFTVVDDKYAKNYYLKQNAYSKINMNTFSISCGGKWSPLMLEFLTRHFTLEVSGAMKLDQVKSMSKYSIPRTADTTKG